MKKRSKGLIDVPRTQRVDANLEDREEGVGIQLIECGCELWVVFVFFCFFFGQEEEGEESVF